LQVVRAGAADLNGIEHEEIYTAVSF
jgi:hypothetical protein